MSTIHEQGVDRGLSNMLDDLLGQLVALLGSDGLGRAWRPRGFHEGQGFAKHLGDRIAAAGAQPDP